MTMQSASTKAEELAVAFLSRVWRGVSNDLDAIDELMTEDYEIHSGGTTIVGRKNFKEWVASFQKILLDAKNDILAVFANGAGDMVVARWRCTGRNNGIFGLAPDGRDVSFTGIAIWRVRDGRLAECWVERAALEAYRALASPNDQT
jgi:predicted ester cyclase